MISAWNNRSRTVLTCSLVILIKLTSKTRDETRRGSSDLSCVTPLSRDCHVSAVPLHNRHRRWGRSRRQSPPDSQRDRLTDRERSIAHVHTPCEEALNAWAANSDHLPEKRLVKESTDTERVPAPHMNTTNHPPITAGCPVGWSRYRHIFNLSVRHCDRGDKLADPEALQLLGPVLFPIWGKRGRIYWFICCCHWRISRHSQFSAIKTPNNKTMCLLKGHKVKLLLVLLKKIAQQFI